MEQVLQELMVLLYGRVWPDGRVAIEDVLRHFPVAEENKIEAALGLLASKNMIALNLRRDTVLLAPVGKVAFEKGCTLEMCFGTQYILRTYRGAFVRISVLDHERDPASGSGFFAADFPGWVATAAHVVDARHTIVDIRDEHENILCAENFEVRRAPNQQLDLALVRCGCPIAINGLRIEWDSTVVRELDEVIVAGYPPISLHRPALVLSRGEIASLPTLMFGDRRSLMISRVTEPGFSGAPVIDPRGFVIGIVERENILTDKQGNRSIFVTATPAYHFATF